MSSGSARSNLNVGNAAASSPISIEYLKENVHPDYDRILKACSLASSLVQEPNPVESLESDQYRRLDHGITHLAVSNTMEDYKKLDTKLDHDGFEIYSKYAICRQKHEKGTRIIVAFSAVKSAYDFFTDAHTLASIEYEDEYYKHFHYGILSQAQTIPIKYFVDEILRHKDNEVVFTGHNLGAAVACLVAIRVLLSDNVAIRPNLAGNQLFYIGFGCPLFVTSDFHHLIAKVAPNVSNRFHFYTNNDEFVLEMLDYLSHVPFQQVLQSLDDIRRWKDEIASNLFDCLTDRDGDEEKQQTVHNLMQKAFLQIDEKEQAKSVEEFQKTKPMYVKFGWWIRIKDETNKTMELIKLDESNDRTSRDHFNKIRQRMIEYKKSSDPSDLLPAFGKHLMKSYVKSFIDTFEWTTMGRSESLNTTLPDELMLEKVVGKWRCEECGSKVVAIDEGFSSYSVEVFRNDTHSDVVVFIYTPNLTYLFGVVLEIENANQSSTQPPPQQAYLSPVVIFNTFGDEYLKFKFTCENDALVNEDTHRLRIRMYSYFNSVAVDVRTWRVNPNKWSDKQRDVMDMSLTNLYLHAAYYIKLMQPLKNKASSSMADNDKEMSQGKQFIANSEQLENIFCEMWERNSADDRDAWPDLQEKKVSLEWLGIVENVEVKPHKDDLKSAILETEINSLFLEVFMSLCELVRAQGDEMFRNRLQLPTAPEATTARTLSSTTSPLSEEAKKQAKIVKKHMYRAFESVRAIILMNNRKRLRLTSPFSDMMVVSESNYGELVRSLHQAHSGTHVTSPYLNVHEDYISRNQRELKERFPELKNIIDLIASNYEIRKVLVKGVFLGVVGSKKNGKSSFVKRLTNNTKKTGASATIETKTMAVYPISYTLDDGDISSYTDLFRQIDAAARMRTSNSVIDDSIFWSLIDYPHSDSTNIHYKLQFVFSKLFLDYVFVIYDCTSMSPTGLTYGLKDFLDEIHKKHKNRFMVVLTNLDKLAKDDGLAPGHFKAKLIDYMKRIQNLDRLTALGDRVVWTSLIDGGVKALCALELDQDQEGLRIRVGQKLRRLALAAINEALEIRHKSDSITN